MPVHLNHTIVSVRDKQESATFLAEILGVAPPTPYGPFLVVQVDNDVSLDFADRHGPVHPQHYAFLVGESEFDQIFGRIRERGLPYLGRPRADAAGRVQHQRWWARRLLGGPERPLPGDHHPTLRRLTGPPPAALSGRQRRGQRVGSATLDVAWELRVHRRSTRPVALPLPLLPGHTTTGTEYGHWKPCPDPRNCVQFLSAGGRLR